MKLTGRRNASTVEIEPHISVSDKGELSVSNPEAGFGVLFSEWESAEIFSRLAPHNLAPETSEAPEEESFPEEEEGFGDDPEEVGSID